MYTKILKKELKLTSSTHDRKMDWNERKQYTKNIRRERFRHNISADYQCQPSMWIERETIDITGGCHSPLLRLNATIAVILGRVVGVETPAVFWRRRHGGRLLSSLAVTRIHSGGVVIAAADNSADSGAVVVADVQRGERRRRGRQLLLSGGGADGTAG